MKCDLIELIKQYPDLPVFAWVDSEVVRDDSYMFWLGEFGRAGKTKIVLFEMYGEERVFEYSGRDEIEEYIWDRSDDDLTFKSYDEVETYVKSLSWEDAILVKIETPDSLWDRRVNDGI